MTRISNDFDGENARRNWRRALLGSTALIGGLILSVPTMAQDQDDATADEEKIEEIVVTGSRIKRSGFESAAPMDVILASEAAPLGFSDVSSLLRSTTIAAGSPQLTSALSTAFGNNSPSTPGGAGVETISLRGLGSNRTLVLLNGRRAGPAGIRGSVSAFDFNVLPLSVIERIEILKDGASSVYGSDAVAGVINIITKKQDGGSLDAYGSVPLKGGGEEYRISGSYGKVFDRGNFRVTADYYRREELAKGDRDYFSCGENKIFDQQTGERADLVDPRTGEFRCSDWSWGHVWTYDYAETHPDGNGTTNLPESVTLVQFDFDGALAAAGLPSVNDLADPANPTHMNTPPGWFPVGYDPASTALQDSDHPFQDEETLIPYTERFTIMAEGEYELTNDIALYAEALFNRRENYENHYGQYWSYIYNDNFNFYDYYLTPDSGGPLSDGWTGAQWFSPTPVIDHFDNRNIIDYFRGVAGLKGSIGESGWDFDVSGQFSKSDAEYWGQFIWNDSVWSNNPVGWGGGTGLGGTGCADFDRLDVDGNVIANIQCVNVDWLNPENMRGNLTQAERDFLLADETGTTVYEQYSFDAAVTGDLFDMPAGPVGAAFGVHYRHDSLNDTPGDAAQAGNVWGSGAARITAGEQNTKAVFAEVDIPLLVGKPLIERFSVSASGRYTDVNVSGDGFTYKVGLNWAVTPEIRIRATRGTSFRTPALFELFLEDEATQVRQSILDPCFLWGQGLGDGDITQRQADNCAADGLPSNHTASITGTVLTGGGLGTLEAETSTSSNIGIVWSPGFADLQISVDYFRIEIRDEVTVLGGANIVFGCYDSPNFPTDPLCDLFTRTPQDQPLPGAVTQVRDKFVNIAVQEHQGVDIAATFRTELPWGIDLRIDTQHTITTKDSIELFTGFPEDKNGLAGDPKWVGNLIFTGTKGPWSATWGIRGVGGTSNVEDNGGSTITFFTGLPDEVEYDIDIEIPAVFYHNVSLARELPNGFTARLGVSNLFAKDPPSISNVGSNINVVGASPFFSQYDWEGRRVFFQVTKKF